MLKQFYFKQFSLVHCLVLFKLIDRTSIRFYHSRPEWTWERWQWNGSPHSLKLQHYWNLTIWLFSVIYTTFVGGYPFAKQQLMYSTAPAHWTTMIYGGRTFWLLLSKLNYYFQVIRHTSLPVVNKPNCFVLHSRVSHFLHCLHISFAGKNVNTYAEHPLWDWCFRVK